MKFIDYINESSLSRVQKAWMEFDTGTITAFRSYHDCGNGDIITKKENLDRNSILKSKLLKRGYGITKIKGSWLENNLIERGEISFFVVDIKNTGSLKNDLIELGDLFEQDAITFSKKLDDYYAISTNKCKESWPGFGVIGKESKLGKPKFGKTGINGFSRVGNRAFVFESNTIDTKMNHYPTEIRSIDCIDAVYPDKQSIIIKLKDNTDIPFESLSIFLNKCTEDEKTLYNTYINEGNIDGLRELINMETLND